ncbi:hypothetical protein KBD59_00545 [Candidatus Gracilibacteria bacterium]|nr:hypothetical protein [Candidatus Gracilibacteria bacterium]
MKKYSNKKKFLVGIFLVSFSIWPGAAYAASQTLTCNSGETRAITAGTYVDAAGTTFTAGSDLTLNSSGGTCTFTLTLDQAASAVELASLTIDTDVTLSHDISGTTADTYNQLKLAITGALTINSSGKIDVSGKGYQGGSYFVYPYSGYTVGNTAGSEGLSGGSHGGEGGYIGYTPPVYDSISNPVLPGGGGGASSFLDGGDGGGVIIITAASVVNNGSILADGTGAFPNFSSGAGGSINITVTGTITGAGTIGARGADSANYGAGGGGRIALKGYTSLDGALTIAANGGNFTSFNPNRDGAAGTIFQRSSTGTYGDLIIKNTSSITSPNFPTHLPATVPTSDQYAKYGSGYVFDSVTVSDYGLLSISTTFDSVQDGTANFSRKFYSSSCTAADDSVANGEIIFNADFYTDSVSNSTYDYTCAAPAFLVGFATSATSGSETSTSKTFTVSTSGVADAQVTVDYAITGTATADADYTLAAGTATIPISSSSDDVSFTVINDLDRESSETMIITLSNPTNATLPTGNAVFTYTITDNDTPGITVTESSSSTDVTEGTSTDDYTVVLLTQPTADVTITPTGDTQATVSPSSLTFTSTNWATPQTITVTTVDDATAEGSHTATITNASTSTDVDYGGMPVSSVTANITDNDYAGTTVTQNNGYQVTASEQDPTNNTGWYRIALNTQPTADVTITPSPSAECTVSPSSITLTTSNWATPQTITVTAVDDADADAYDSCNITHSITTTDSQYASQYIGITASITDNDTAGMTVTPTSITEIEGGTPGTYTVVLTAAPTDDVTVTITDDEAEGVNEATFSPATLTFTSANWNTPQTVTVTAVNDAVIDAVTSVNLTNTTTSADTRYQGIYTPGVSTYVYDNDHFTITQSSSSTDVLEEGATTDTFTVVMAVEPTGFSDIEVTVTSTADATVATDPVTSPVMLIFNTANWNTPQTITVAAVDDTDVEVGDTATVSFSVNDKGWGNFLNTSIDPLTVNVTDNDGATAGVTITEVTGTAVTEGGAGDTYTVVLDGAPTASVTINLTAGADLTLSDSSLLFTTGNWDTPQTVTVTAYDDSIVESEETPSITHAAVSDDTDYQGISIASVTVTVTDNDIAGITVTPTSGLNTTEGGVTDTFTVVLDTQPTADVSVGISSSNTDEGTVSPSSLTFTNTNWATPQTVTVAGVNDYVDDGDIAYTIITAAATSSDGNYNTVNAANVSVTNTDNDTVGITVTPTSGLTTTEAGGTDTFTVVLNTMPTADVSVGVTSSNTDEGTISAASLVFTNTNWATPQTVTVTGVNDDVDDGDVAYTIVTAAATSSDGNYNTVNAADVSVTNTDNDTAGITVTPTSGLATTELSAGTATFTLVLNSEPTADVSIGISSSDTTEGTVSASSLTFTTANWDSAQTVTVTGVDDYIDDNNVTYSIVTAAATSSDGSYNTLDASNVSATNTDNDTAGITVTPTSGLTTTESGAGTATFTVVLGTQPTANVVVGITSSDTTEGTVSASTLTFTTTNWATAQTVTVTGVDDGADDGDVAYSIVTAAATSTDDTYNTMNASNVSVTNTDNDVVGITLTESQGSTNVTEGGDNDSFIVILTSAPTSGVTITPTCDAQCTISPESVIFTDSNWNTAQTFTVTAQNDTTVEGAHTGVITNAIQSADLLYSVLTIGNISVAIGDNDAAAAVGGSASGLGSLTTPAVRPAADEQITTAAPTDGGSPTIEPIPQQAVPVTPTAGISVRFSVGGVNHSLRVQSSNDGAITFILRSKPLTLTLKKGETTDVDTDLDGIKDVRVTYKGLLASGKPELIFVNLTNKAELSHKMSINAGAYQTDVSDIKLKLNAPAASKMAISNRSDFRGASYVPYNPSVNWKLTPGKGRKTVYVRFKDKTGKITQARDTIQVVKTVTVKK